MKKTINTYWLYLKYQIITKSLVYLILIPIFSSIINYLIRSTGRTNLTSGDYIKFFFSFEGIGFLICSLIIMTILIGLDINSFIIITAMLKENKLEHNIYNTLILGIKSIKQFLNPKAILLMIYVSVLVPLIGLGITISPMKNFQIPNFITSVIFANKVYLSIYIIILLVIFIISLRYIFIFHYMLIAGYNIKTSATSASNLIMNNKKAFFNKVVLRILKITLSFLFVIVLLISISVLFKNRYVNIFGILTATQIISSLSLLFIPIVISILTDFVYEYGNIKLNIEIKKQYKFKDGIFTLRNFIIIILLFNIVFTIFTTHYFDQIFVINRDIQIVAHRAGGNLGAENTIYGLEKAIENKASYSEIDIQRTKDGYYIINHDKTFSRLTGVNKSSSEITFEEIKKLKVKDLFNKLNPAQEVASLEEFLEKSKGKIKLFLELKGATADEKMVDDVIEMVKARNMQSEVVLISLDYNIIKYIESKYNYINTGFIYFFAIGELKNLQGDYLIMEEREASPSNIRAVQESGKKAVVWTVNTEESIKRFVNTNIDAIITDDILSVQKAIEKRNKMTDLNLIIYKLLEE